MFILRYIYINSLGNKNIFIYKCCAFWSIDRGTVTDRLPDGLGDWYTKFGGRCRCGRVGCRWLLLRAALLCRDDARWQEELVMWLWSRIAARLWRPGWWRRRGRRWWWGWRWCRWWWRRWKEARCFQVVRVHEIVCVARLSVKVATFKF